MAGVGGRLYGGAACTAHAALGKQQFPSASSNVCMQWLTVEGRYRGGRRGGGACMHAQSMVGGPRETRVGDGGHGVGVCTDIIVVCQPQHGEGWGEEITLATPPPNSSLSSKGTPYLHVLRHSHTHCCH